MKSLILGMGLLVYVFPVEAEMITFDHMKTGEMPDGWHASVTGTGTAKWTVEADETALSKPNVLKQSGVGTFPICVLTNSSLTDGYVEVKFKPLSGQEDQAGGVLWRWTDDQNYYVARANALEDNVSIYYTLGGKRHTIKYEKANVAKNQWHRLRVDFKANNFTVTFDGEQVLQVQDDHIKGAGSIGVWTKADSMTLFDDFQHGTP